MVLKPGDVRESIRNTSKILNVVLEKDEEDQLDQSCEKRSITKSQGGEEYPTNNRKK